MFSTDDELDMSGVSSTDMVTKGSYLSARKEALKREMEKKSMDKGLSNKVDPTKGKLQLSALKQQVEGKKDDMTKRDQQKEKSTSFGTKTRMQEEKQEMITADTKPDADKLVNQGQSDKKAQEEVRKTDVSTEGG